VVHSVVLSLCRRAGIIDLSHEVPAHDVRAGAAMLRRAAPYLVPGVILAVVDPGVGGKRRRVVLDCGRWQLVGPDNGLLVAAAGMLGGIRRAVEATDPGWWLPRPAMTFDGRDIFGPLAAHLCLGVDAERFGPRIEPEGLERFPDPIVGRTAEGTLLCEVDSVDRFGNVGLTARPPDLPGSDTGELTVRTGAGGTNRPARRVTSFAELGPEELGLLTDSTGHLALVLDRAQAATWLAVSPGDRIEIGPWPP
jgi:S-adenosyl-L-methionine hydrolase (adenosine-forming)